MDRELIKKWKINRDVIERGYNLDKVIKQIETRQTDYDEYIKNQKENADIIIKYFEIMNDLKCNIVVKNSVYINKIILNKKYINYEIILKLY